MITYIKYKFVGRVKPEMLAQIIGLHSRGFNGSVNISESCDFRSQFDPLYIIFLNTFLSAYIFLMKKYRINKSVNLKIVEL